MYETQKLEISNLWNQSSETRARILNPLHRKPSRYP